MEIRYLLALLRAHLPFVVIATLVAGATGLLATYVLPEKYEAPTLILIRPQPQRNFASTAETKATLDYPVSFNIPPESISETYGTIMTSPAVAKRVVEILGLHQPPPPEATTFFVGLYRSLRNTARRTVSYVWDFVRYGRVEDKDPYWTAVDDVIEGLKAKPIEDTYLFKLTATWNDPKVAAAIADTAAQVFVDYTLQARRKEQSTAVDTTTQRLERVQAQLVEARERLRAFEGQHQSAVPTRRLELKLDSLTEVEGLRDEVTRQMASTEARIKNVQEQLLREPTEVQSVTTLARNEFLNTVRTELAADERKLAERLETMMPEHPEVIALRARIAASTKRIADEQEMIRMRNESTRNPVLDSLRRDLLEAQTARASLTASAAKLDQSKAVLRQDIEALVGTRTSQERLALDVTVLEDEFKFVAREQAEALLAVSQELSDIRALAPAIAPVYPRGPLKILYAGLGLVAGLFLALGLLLVIDYAEPRVRSREDIDRLVGVPVVSVLRLEPRRLTSPLVDADPSPQEVWRVVAASLEERKRRDES